MAYLEHATLHFDRRNDETIWVTGHVIVVKNSMRRLVQIKTTTLPLDHPVTLDREVDELLRIVRWEVTDAVIRNRFLDMYIPQQR